MTDGKKMIARRAITMEPDDTAIGGIKSKETRVGSPLFSATWLQAPKLRIHNLGREGQMKATLGREARSERSRQAQIEHLSLGKTPATVVHRSNRERDTENADSWVGLSGVM